MTWDQAPSAEAQPLYSSVLRWDFCSCPLIRHTAMGKPFLLHSGLSYAVWNELHDSSLLASRVPGCLLTLSFSLCIYWAVDTTSPLGSLDSKIRTTLSMHGEARDVLHCVQGKNVQTPPGSLILTQHRLLLLPSLPSSSNCCPSQSQGIQPLPTGLTLLLRGKDSEINQLHLLKTI